MALMFPRLARNFIRNGYFPTDEPTLERALSHWCRLPAPCPSSIPAPAKAWRLPKPPTPSGASRSRPSPSSTTPSVPATHGNLSIAASKVI